MDTATSSSEVEVFPHRFAGVCGLLFVGLAILQNVIRGAGSPPNAISVGSELEFATGHARLVGLLLSMFVLGMIALYGFSIGVFCSTMRRNAAARYWGALGVVGTILIGVFFSTVNLTEALMVTGAAGLAAHPALAQLVWNLHNAAFAINLAAIAIALFSFSRALTLARMIPRWLWPAGVICSILLMLAALPVLSETKGSPWFTVGVPGFLCWLVLIVAASLALLRFGTTTPAAEIHSPAPVERERA